MVSFICLFFPAVVALWLFEKVNHYHFNLKKMLYNYCIFNLCINGICFFIKEYLLNTGMYTLTGSMKDMSVTAAFHYLVMAIPLSIIFPLIATVLSRNIKITKESQK